MLRIPSRASRPSALVSVAFAFALVAGCSQTAHHPPELGNEQGVPPPLGGGAPTSGGHDGGGAADGGACTILINQGSVVSEQMVGEASPAPIGGAIAPGTYLLTAINLFTGLSGNSGPTGRQYQETARFDISTYEDVRAQSFVDGGQTTTIGVTGNYSTNASSLTLTPTCPASAATTITYSVIGTTLHLFAGQNEFVYALQ